MLPWLAQRASRFAINHLFASPAERVLAPRLNRTPGLITLAKDSPSLSAMERDADTLRKFRFVVVESERHRELLRQLRVPNESLKLIYPGVRNKPYTPPEGPFSIVFATSPFARHRFLTRGIHLMLRVAQRLPEIRFVLVWRRANEAELRRLLQECGVRNVEVRSGYIEDMDAVYRSVHATILPGAEENSFQTLPAQRARVARARPACPGEPAHVHCAYRKADGLRRSLRTDGRVAGVGYSRIAPPLRRLSAQLPLHCREKVFAGRISDALPASLRIHAIDAGCSGAPSRI